MASKVKVKKLLFTSMLVLLLILISSFLGYFIFQNEKAKRSSGNPLDFIDEAGIEGSRSDIEFALNLPEYNMLFTGLVKEELDMTLYDIISNYSGKAEEIRVAGLRSDDELIEETFTGIKLGLILESMDVSAESKSVIVYASDLYAADFTVQELFDELYIVWRRGDEFLDPQKDGVIKIVQDKGSTKKWVKNPVLFDFIKELHNDPVTGELDEKIISFFAQHRFFTLSIGEEPQVEINNWELRIDGLVDDPQVFDYDAILGMPRISIYTTLETISNPRSGLGFLKGDAVWTGVPFSYILDLAGVSEDALEVVFYCLDGYSTSITIEEAYREDVILSYRMNGMPLFREHGFPVRMVVPGKYGMKWAKWIERIEIVDYDYRGFWEKRGWSDDATREEYKKIFD